MRTYIHTGLHTPGLTSSRENANAKTHTADKASLDGEIQSQGLVNV